MPTPTPPVELPAGLLADRTVFISGGGSGVNLAIAEACARAGASVAVCGRTEARLAQAVERLEALGARATYAVADVRDPVAVAAALEASRTRLGPADAVVCGAAGNFLARSEALSSNGFRTVVDIDLQGSFHVAQAAFDQLRETRGNLLFVSGGQSEMAMVHQAHVAAAKSGVDQMMRSLAVEWGPLGVRANSIAPGPVAGTEGMDRLAELTGAQTWLDSIPLGRYAELEEIGRIAAVLVSPWSAYVNGARVVLDGGLSLVGPALVNQALVAQSRSAQEATQKTVRS